MDKNEIFKELTEYKNNKQYKKLLKCAKEAAETFNDNCFYNEMYNCLIILNKKTTAVKILKKMLINEPNKVSLYKKIAYLYYQLGKYKKALEYYTKVLVYEPLSSENYFNTASIYHYLKELNIALIHYDASLKLNPKNINSLNNKGILLYELGKWENALCCFKEAINYSKNHPEAYHHIGKIYREFQADYELSELYLKKAILLDPKYSDNYYQLAITYEKNSKHKEAISTLEKCLEINSKHKNAKLLLEKIKSSVKGN